jgi:hypothetical protein
VNKVFALAAAARERADACIRPGDLFSTGRAGRILRK